MNHNQGEGVGEHVTSIENALTPVFPTQVSDVVTSEEAVCSLAHLNQELAVDVEADAMYRFESRLCFVQVGTADQIFLFDTLAAPLAVSALAEKFLDANVVKYFHAAQGDLMYLAEAGLRVNGLFDTHRAATLLLWPKLGLVDLVRQFCGAELKKEHQQADFSLRPLPAQLREYISDDVKYLTYVGQQVRQKCIEADIYEEVVLDCQKLCDEATVRRDPLEQVPKVPKKKSAPENLFIHHVAITLHKARLEWAREKDVPLGRMLSNAAITALALMPPKDLKEMGKREGVRGAFVREYGERVMALMQEVQGLVDTQQLPPLAPKTPANGAVTRRSGLLTEFRKKHGEARKVSPSVVLTNSLLEALATTPPRTRDELLAVKYFGEKRMLLYGKALLEILKD
jgi:ribonuclease D